jgi:hypothetical protein
VLATAVVVGVFAGVLLNAAPAAGVLADPPVYEQLVVHQELGSSPRVTVASGDSVSELAPAAGVTQEEFLETNGERFAAPGSEHEIVVGERLLLPATWDGTWTVQPGDTLWSIAQRFGTNPASLAALQEPGRFPDEASWRWIQPGEVLRIVPAPAAEPPVVAPPEIDPPAEGAPGVEPPAEESPAGEPGTGSPARGAGWAGPAVAALLVTTGVGGLFVAFGMAVSRWRGERRLRAWQRKARAWADVEVFAAQPRSGPDAVRHAGATARAQAALQDPALDRLRAAAPPAYVAALLRNPVEVLGEQELYGATEAEIATSVAAGLRGAIWDAAAAHRSGRERTEELDELVAPVVAARKEMERIGAEVRVLSRGTAAGGELTAARQRYADAWRRMQAVADAALNEAAVAGFSRHAASLEVSKASRGWKRSQDALAGLVSSFLTQLAGAAGLSTLMFAAHTGQSLEWVAGLGLTGMTITVVVGLATAALGNRLIKNMWLIVTLMVLGAVAAGAMGIGGHPVLFTLAFVALGVSSQAGGLIRGRLDVYHPVPAALKPVRDTRYETVFKVGRVLFPALIIGGIWAVGVPVTMLVFAAMTLGMAALVWVLLRGEHPMAQPRAPPAVRAELVGMVRQIVGTPLGLLRWVLSVPLLTVVTGLPGTALGVTILDQLVLLNDPTQAVFATAATVMVIVAVSRVASLLVGMAWPRLKRLLGRQGHDVPGRRTARCGSCGRSRCCRS